MQSKTNCTHPPAIIGDYTINTNSVLGKGATGIVYKGFHTFTKQPVAVKAVDLATIRDEATRALLQNEKEGLRTVQSPSVMKLIDIVEDGQFCCIVTELCEGVTLEKHLQEKGTLGESEAMAIFRKLTAGAQAVAQEVMIHRDLKPANVMVDCRGEVKIIDFGYCEIIRAKKVMKTFNVGSPSYMSPQAYLRTLYSQKSDAWSLGVILYEMVHGHTIDQGMDIKQYFEALKSDAHFLQKKISSGICLQVRQIIEKALKYQPEERLSISALKYQTDLYHVNLKQKNTNINHQVQPVIPFRKQTPKVHFHDEAVSVKNVSVSLNSENKVSGPGFVSFKEFVDSSEKQIQANPNQNKGNTQLRMKPLTSLDDFDRQSDKASSSLSKGVAMGEKLTFFMQNTVKQPKLSRPESISGSIPVISRPPLGPTGQPLAFPPRMIRHATLPYS